MSESTENKKISADDIERGQNQIAAAYLKAVLELCFHGGSKELDFVKKTVTTPGGGIYLLQLQHVAGPKIDVQAMFTPDQEKAKEPPPETL